MILRKYALGTQSLGGNIFSSFLFSYSFLCLFVYISAPKNEFLSSPCDILCGSYAKAICICFKKLVADPPLETLPSRFNNLKKIQIEMNPGNYQEAGFVLALFQSADKLQCLTLKVLLLNLIYTNLICRAC